MLLGFGPIKKLKHFKQIYFDLILIAFALTICYLTRNHWKLPVINNYSIVICCIFIFGRLFTNKLFGIYNQIWRYINYSDLIRIGISLFTFSGMATLLSFILEWKLSFGFILTELVFTSIFLISARLIRRAIYDYNNLKKIVNRANCQNVLLIGAGEAGQQVLREMRLASNLDINVIGFLDDDDSKIGKKADGVPILGKISDIKKLTFGADIKQIIICIPSLNRKKLNKITSLCAETGIPTKILPGLAEILNGNVNLNQIRAIDIADVLNRDEIKFEFESINYLNDQKILVTGAGGSIGSELCRQIAGFYPSEILLLGKGENSIYLIEQEFRENFPNIKVVPIIADVKDRTRVEAVLKLHRPNVIFHAAAHKHVPLMESHPAEAVLNNIAGTANIAELASLYGVKKFVMISTDKAVNSTNVMGASKRVAEMIVQSMAKESNNIKNAINNYNSDFWGIMETSKKVAGLLSDSLDSYTKTKTEYTIVRFGNVLESRGSVIPKFKQQIAKGGPITVTHPDITRYFMTIPEAAQLVIQAGNIGSNGEIFVLDMGKPVKITELARALIKLSGKVPDEDIRIEFVGLRPGEKIYEELLTAEEGTKATCYDRIFIAPFYDIDINFVKSKVKKLLDAAVVNNNDGIRKILIEELNVLKPFTAVKNNIRCDSSEEEKDEKQLVSLLR